MEIIFIILIVFGGLEALLHLFLGDWSKKFEDDNKENPTLIYRVIKIIGNLIFVGITLIFLFVFLYLLFEKEIEYLFEFIN